MPAGWIAGSQGIFSFIYFQRPLGSYVISKIVNNKIVLIGPGNRVHATFCKNGTWSNLFSNLFKSGLGSYVVKHSERHILGEFT